MRIGFIQRTFGRAGGPEPVPTWEVIRDTYLAAAEVGFDIFVYEDALMYRREDATDGLWESMALSGALAATPADIQFGHSVINAPYRSAALVAATAVTLDEISGGRYVLGIGAGNTDDADYLAFGFPTDNRYSRFAEALPIIHSLLKTGKADTTGEYHSAVKSELGLRGPTPGGPPIVVAAGGSKMLRLTAEYGDGWNWWVWGLGDPVGDLRPKVEELDKACEEIGRDPATLQRTIDVYTIDLVGHSPEDARHPEGHVFHGTAEQLAERLLPLTELGIDEIRIDHHHAPTPEGMVERAEAMAELVKLIHAG